jgi:hypothetical protein
MVLCFLRLSYFPCHAPVEVKSASYTFSGSQSWESIAGRGFVLTNVHLGITSLMVVTASDFRISDSSKWPLAFLPSKFTQPPFHRHWWRPSDAWNVATVRMWLWPSDWWSQASILHRIQEFSRRMHAFVYIFYSCESHPFLFRFVLVVSSLVFLA